MALSIQDCEGDSATASKGGGKRGGRESIQSPNSHLLRQISNDGLASVSDTEFDKSDCCSSSGRSSPGRCVSEFDTAAKTIGMDGAHAKAKGASNMPLQDSKLLEIHSRALRLEAELQPMRLILSRLMLHSTLNRKGLFNIPVDPVALGLADYHDVVKKPMDLGTIKVKLHAIAYESRRQVADDIRLVFDNAMTYNPPHNAVHAAAKGLLAFFEDQIQAFAPELASVVAVQVNSSVLAPAAVSPSADVAVPHPGAPAPVHNLGTRNSVTADLLVQPINLSKKRAKRGSKVDPGHACNRCRGQICMICAQGCLALESTLLICNGPHCAGTRIRKGAVYFVSADGGRHFCQRCHTGLPGVLPQSGHDEQIRYKRDLLKRKNDEEIVEHWLHCSQCGCSVHRMCALLDEYVHDESVYRCPGCVTELGSAFSAVSDSVGMTSQESESDVFTFVSGSLLPVKLSEVVVDSRSGLFRAEALPENEVSSFIQKRVRERLRCAEYPNAELTVLVRVVSDCHRCFKVPEVVRTHFRMATQGGRNESVAPPHTVNYRSKGIALFQKIDGLDVCIFCMYVHEYDGDDHFEDDDDGLKADQKKRVYVAYLDSVEHFRPRSCRTIVYHEILVAYLATARERGFEVAHIWSCPPSRGNCFVFWNHPTSQRTPNPERLESWYHAALSRAVDCGVVTDVQSLYETTFKPEIEADDESLQKGYVQCPPLLDGDFWIEEAVRLHGINMARHLKAKVEDSESSLKDATPGGSCDRCPARLVASMLNEHVIPHPSALPFRRPVNAAALKLTDYHEIIANPMDLGTVCSRCILGEYSTLAELVSDVELVFSNAKTYNPKGHVVHMKADEVRDIFFSHLNQLVRPWIESDDDSTVTWETVATTSLSLDVVLKKSQLDPRGDMVVGPRMHSAPELGDFGNKENRATDVSSPVSLLGGGPEAVQNRMIGEDTWLLDKNQAASKGSAVSKLGGSRKRRSALINAEDEPASKRRRQAWLGVEVGTAVRRMRTSFFSCSLTSKSEEREDEQRAVESYRSYTRDFKLAECDEMPCASSIADVRHSLLEFSQFRNLEFDTLRHAKYSTAVLLRHFHDRSSPGVVPVCTECHNHIKDVRWHKVCKVICITRRKAKAPADAGKPEELCQNCYHSKHKQDDQFVPLQVTLCAHSPIDSTSHRQEGGL
jgi:hypothetical protein